ncbi:helix-turn-helix domain-containing protein [Brevundimonas diminuta]|jgi:transcriptional regulator with XRE-family HTH domain|uniref:helix-turn-helix domain-containing protein n=1 Tax=Brevundimonas TaxID=41275 RepID=UPI000EC982DF|nr:transcriptional regulator [Brevundimonas sp.]
MDGGTLLGRNILHFRSLRMWSQQDLAGEAGLSLRYLAGIERGEENPSLKTLTAIASAIRVPTWSLLHPDSQSVEQI